MALEKNYVTREGLEQLKSELEHLIQVEEPKVIEELAEARAQGDLSENADYDAAREKQAQLHARKQELEAMISNAVILEENANSDVAGIGSKVRILDLSENEEETLIIVGSVEANPFEGKLSNVSPLGSALNNARVGDVVTVNGVEVPYQVKVLEISKP